MKALVTTTENARNTGDGGSGTWPGDSSSVSAHLPPGNGSFLRDRGAEDRGEHVEGSAPRQVTRRKPGADVLARTLAAG